MFITPAFAQGAGSDGGLGIIGQFIPLILIFVIFYFLLIRPQQQRMKQHQEMISALRRGDTIVTAGGMIAKVTKVIDDNEVRAEISDGVNIRVVRNTIAEVRTKGEPVKDDK